MATLNGTSGPDTITGTSANDTISGLAGDDILDGRGGDDTIDGGDDNDRLIGGTGNDILNGGAGDDVLNSGAGSDSLTGGTGNDEYWVDSISDTVNENGGEGDDAVVSTISWTLGTNVERLSLLGSSNIDGTGNNDANIIVGNSGNNALTGRDGNDGLIGGAGNDTLEGGHGNDSMTLGTGNDAVTFSAGDGQDIVTDLGIGDTVVVHGYVAAQSIAQTGSSVVVILSPTDRISFLNTTVAAVQAAISFDASHIVGTSGDDNLHGGAANDTIDGLAGNDVLTGGSGNDTINGGDNNDRLVGETGNDTLNGDAGNDVLNGGAGNDAMTGGTGDDEYWVDSIADTVSENSGEGDDAVVSKVSWTLGANVERLSLIGGSANIDGTGNGDANIIVGNNGNNQLSGLAGNDYLDGGAGADTILGGTDADTLYGGTGGDQIDGGDGIDTAVFAGSYLDYSIVKNGGGSWTVTHTASSDQDTLTNVENLQFDNLLVDDSTPLGVSANDDVGTANEDTGLTVNAAAGVLSNDTDFDGDSLTVTGVTGGTVGVGFTLPSGAVLTMNADGSYTYDTNGQFEALRPGDTDTDSFTYTASDGHGNFDTATATITINGANEVPAGSDDTYNGVTGNTPFSANAAAGVLANDSDPDQPSTGLSVTQVQGTDISSGVIAVTGGTVTMSADGSFTFNPTAGFSGAASFNYTVTDADGGTDTATATINVVDPVWYVDAANGSDVTGDGTYAKPFASMAPLTTGGSADALDNANDTIFVYNTGTYTGGITLEAGQVLYGDSHSLTVNGIQIGTANNSNSTINHSGAAITLATGNTVDGLNLVGTLTSAVGIQDGNGTVGTVTISNTAVSGQGQIIDIDQGGTLAVSLQSAASTGSSVNNGGVIDLTGVGGTFTVAAATTINGTQAQTGIDLTGNSSLSANFNGATTVNTGAQQAVNLGANTTSTTNFTAGLDIDTTTGTGFAGATGNTLAISGGTNSINTTTGQIISLASTAIGASGVTFTTLGASGSVAATAINLSDVDGNSFNGGTVTIGGTGGGPSRDGIFIGGGSTTNFTFAAATIGATSDEGIEINGAGNGTVTFTTVAINGSGGNGVEINGATNSVTINGGTIGNTDDPAGDGVNITGGTGAVTIAAAITKTTLGNEVVDVSNHASGAISFSGALNASSGGGGIRIVNNSSGNIDFTNSAVNLNTGTLNAITFTNTNGTGANVTLSGGNLNVDTTSGTGINATNSTVGAGSLTISGANNSVAATTGRAINVDGVTLNSTFHDVGVSGGGTTTGVFLQNTGASGQFVVTGTGSTAGSGGTIGAIGGSDMGSAGAAATQGTGIYLQNVSNVSLANMIIGTNATLMENFGIRGENVNNFTLTDSEFRGIFGDTNSLDEGTIRFGTAGTSTGLKGTAVFQGNSIGGGKEDTVQLNLFGSDTLNLTIKDTAGGDAAVFTSTQALSGGGADFAIETGGTSNLTLNITGVDFLGANGNLIQVTSSGSATQNISITNNNLHNGQATTLSGGAGVLITGSLTNSNITYNIDGNSFKGTMGASIFSMFNGNSGTVTGIVNNNTFGTNNGVKDTAQANYGSLFGGAFFGGIDSKFPGSGVINYAVRISNNTIRDSGSDGVIMLRSATQDSGGSGRVEATISNNTIAEAGTNVAAGIYVQVAGSGAPAGDYGKIGLNVSNNNINLTGASFADGLYIDNGSSLNGTAYFPGYSGPANPFTELSTYMTGKGNVFTNANGSGQGGAATNGTITGANFVLPVPLLAAVPDSGGGWQDTSVHSGGGATLNAAELGQMVDAAIARWAEAGATADQVAAMHAVAFDVVDMSGAYLAQSSAGAIAIDSNGAGYGWFVDTTPGDDSEFANGSATPDGGAAGSMDLLTVIMHELGHQVGLDDAYGATGGDDVMNGYLDLGERRLPGSDDVLAAASTDSQSTSAHVQGWIAAAAPAAEQAAAVASAAVQAAAELQSWPDALVPEFHVSEYENMHQLLVVSSSWGDHQWI